MDNSQNNNDESIASTIDNSQVTDNNANTIDNVQKSDNNINDVESSQSVENNSAQETSQAQNVISTQGSSQIQNTGAMQMGVPYIIGVPVQNPDGTTTTQAYVVGVDPNAMAQYQNVTPQNQVNNELAAYSNTVKQKPVISPLNLEKNDNDYIKDFIGNNSNKIMTRTFNFSALFFQFGYYFFRKHYIFGILSIISYYLVPFVLEKINIDNIYIMYGSVLLFNIILAFLFNKSYVKKANSNLQRIKAKNKAADSYTITGLLRKNGGTSFLLFILGGILFSAPSYFLGLNLPFGSLKNTNSLGLSQNSGNVIDLGNGTTFEASDGVIVYDNINLNDTVNIIVPSGFKEGFMHSNTSYAYEYSFSDNGKECDYDCNVCKIDLHTIKGYKNAKEAAVSFAKKESVSVSSVNKNGITWQNYNYNFVDYTKSYITDYKDKVYLLSFNTSKDGLCKNEFNNILDTFSFK